MASLDKPSKPRPLPKPPSTAEAKGRSRFNFLAASNRDNIVFGSERPGQAKPNPEAPSTPRGPQVPAIIVDQWSAHMRSKGIKRVLCVLNDSELGFYDEDLIVSLKRHFKRSTNNGISGSDEHSTHVKHIVPHAENALADVASFLNDAYVAIEPVVVFCSTGQARTGMILAFWLHHKYSASIAAAVTEVTEYASAHGAARKPSVEQVVQFTVGAEVRGMMPAMRGASNNNQIAFGTPRVDDRMHVTFLQMGGTIDKDYPKTMGGYNFEVCDPAVSRVLQNVATGFTHDVHTVCRRDATDVTLEDRQSLVETIRRINSSKFVVTHGTETMIETAHFVTAAKGLINKTIVFTGSSKPQKLIDSDASFNVGAAIGALNMLGNGVFLCMNGRIFEGNKVRRDGRTGLFVGL